MSQKIVSIHAYDCMDQVNYSARVREYADYQEDSGELVLAQVGTFPGVGEDGPQEWLRDVLVAILEDL